MTSLLNLHRPPAFCPGCSHDRVVRALDSTFQNMGLPGHRVAIVSDIGCCGLFDTFFKTHAFHGLHGRALTYATGLKLARPELCVVTAMGDGGLGIGGAHVLSACRRNLNLTLLVMNNFNYGMTGGQGSATTPDHAQTASGFLSLLEKPLDICQVAAAAGAPYVVRAAATQKDLSEVIEKAISFRGFAVVDIWGPCPGRYLKRNRWNPKQISQALEALPAADGAIEHNARAEFGRHYRQQSKRLEEPPPVASVEKRFKPIFSGRCEVLVLGAAGQRINTAGELLCLAALSSGIYATQKSDYPITVLRGHSISEIVLSDQPIDYTGLHVPGMVLALSAEGVARRKDLFDLLDAGACIIKANGVDLPPTSAKVLPLDIKNHSLKKSEQALVALAALAQMKHIITPQMLIFALQTRYDGKRLAQASALIDHALGVV